MQHSREICNLFRKNPIGSWPIFSFMRNGNGTYSCIFPCIHDIPGEYFSSSRYLRQGRVRCIQDQPDSCCLLRKFFLICGFSIFCYRIRKCTEMEIITAHNLNGMCSIRKSGKPRVLMATAFARYYNGTCCSATEDV